MQQSRINLLSNYFKSTYGARLQKISINTNSTCPNRDGRIGTGGCIYCLNDAFNPSYCSDKSITEQIARGIAFHKKRYARANNYLAYFQTYSNTYGDTKMLIHDYNEALSIEGIEGLVIGTRPDCIDDEILEYLESLTSKYFISIELGIESVYDKSLEFARRGHSFKQAVDAVHKIAKTNIFCGAHFMYGFPTETIEEMIESAAIISSLPLKSVKFHQLQIYKGTELANYYFQNKEKFHIFELNEYIDFIIKIIERLRPDLCIDRIAGEAPPRYVLNTDWDIRYCDVIELFKKRLEETNTWQGKEYKIL